MRTGLVLGVLAVLAPAFGVASPQTDPRGAEDAGAELALPDLEGRRRDLTGYRGRIVVLNFWATWCLPCREEMPALADLQARYADRGVQVIGASTDDPGRVKAVRRAARDLGVNFPIWLDATTDDMRRLGLGGALPATAFVDRDGRIAARILGPAGPADLEERIEWLLGDRAGPAPEPRLSTFERHPHDPEAEPAEEGHARGDEEGHAHGDEEGHAHGGVGLEGASLVPS
jgi:thiol-disulfide isomerase/thioredoxin